MSEAMFISGLGLVTEAVASIGEAGGVVGALPAFEVMGAEGEGEERLAGLAIRAAQQALTMSGGVGNGERMGLVYVSSWGSIDATVAYLESMLEKEGKYASPRHFSRSVYSAVASAVAMRFGIKGPCLTLAFPREGGGGAVRGALAAARRLLAARRTERVLIVWAEQAAEIVSDLASRAAAGLRDREAKRYVGAVGEGAAAAVVGWTGRWGPVGDAEEGEAWGGAAYPMDGAARWVAKWAAKG